MKAMVVDEVFWGELQREESRDVRQHLKGSIHAKMCRKVYMRD